MLGRNLISHPSQYLFAPPPSPPLPFSGQTPPDFINALIRKWGLEFLFANKQISLCIGVAPPLLPLAPAAGEAGRKISMKQRRHAARWLTSGAQGHWCWLEKANTIFYWGIHFHSKSGDVKHPDRSKYSPFIPINNAASIFGRIVWTKNIKHGLCWSGVNLLAEHFESKCPSYGWIYAKEGSNTSFFEVFLQPCCHFRKTIWCHSVYIGTRNTSSLLYPWAMISGLTRIKESCWKRACLCHWTAAVTVLFTATAS